MEESFVATVARLVKLVFEVQEPNAYSFAFLSDVSRNDVRFLVRKREKDHESPTGC